MQSSAFLCMAKKSFAEVCRRLLHVISILGDAEEFEMSRNGQLEAGLKRITEDYHLPGGGQRKLSQLVAEHLY